MTKSDIRLPDGKKAEAYICVAVGKSESGGTPTLVDCQASLPEMLALYQMMTENVFETMKKTLPLPEAVLLEILNAALTKAFKRPVAILNTNVEVEDNA